MITLALANVSMELLVGLTMLLGLTAYAVLAGADFGGGIWVLLSPRGRIREHQDLVAQAIGPVWEANHVWLIFVIVLLFSAFPPAFAAISIAFFVPFHFVLLGIILRGSSFVFRAYGPRQTTSESFWTAIFGAASVITPYLLGISMAAVSMGGIRLVHGAIKVDPVTWFRPFSQLVGLLALSLAAYLAAVYLTLESTGQLREDFRRRAIWSGIVAGGIALVVLVLMPRSAPQLWQSFSHGRAEFLVMVGFLTAIGSIALIVRRRYYWGRTLAVAQVAILLWGWAFAHWPYIIYPDFTFYNAAAPQHVLRIILGVIPPGLVILLPSLWFLFMVFKHKALIAGEVDREE